MGEKLLKNADACYRLAEQRAEKYFQELNEQVSQQTYVDTVTKDIQSWKHNHIHQYSIVSFFRKRQPSTKEYHKYIKWLNYTGKLDNYLNRSISYIFMRDLGKGIDKVETQISIRSVVDSLKGHLIDSTGKETEFSMTGLYRLAQKENIEATLIWVVDKLNIVTSNFPAGMDVEQAKRKIIKIIAGVAMHEVIEMDDQIPDEERTRKLDVAIRLGYSYGLTYPLIDDLLDAKILSAKEEELYTDLIRTTLMTGSVPKLGDWPGSNTSLIRFIHSELRDSFEYIKAQQCPNTKQNFFEQSYVFFNSQEVDRKKDLSNANYTNEELYIPIILKSYSSRVIVRSLISAPVDEGFDDRTFYYGIYNQLADDFTDLFDDMEQGAVTPYTYYMKYHKRRPDLINPFELYWTVISNLIHNVYHSDDQTCEVILDRAINGLKRSRDRLGTKKYKEIMNIFSIDSNKFSSLIQNMVQKANDVDFFDKLLRDHIISTLKNERKEQEAFLEKIKTVRNEINSMLPIAKTNHPSLIKEPLIDAANYSLKGDGKRLRPIMTWVMGVDEFGLNESEIIPLLRSLEYMHTASLIYDDLPSMDNASIRRGRQTLHQQYNAAIAELTGLFLTQKAVWEQASLDHFDSKTVLNLIQYSAQKTADMCQGQAMDLDSKGKQLTLEQLNRMSFYKTGIAFEASLIMPAILAHAQETEIQALKKFAYHAGIMFQIKDDLLDVEGVLTKLGKPIGKDVENNNTTFVSILGSVGAKKAMWEHYCLAMETMQTVPHNTPFLKHLLNYILNRDH
ncbi:polyprenyl synthetase family protein [Aquibacillus halophilus]|uniref:Polyprenyl synthetase family protein n=1 Tax=Aquibacillus halophilus TaxID=930132 RepID=A0A6A8D705_9BACI|nr:polyprenyl synthetase family protein [Aquibacillus halophilus]MRH41394.1 polyprenyl synthetase family protein [Aquibacillus halophilus]